MVCRISCTTTRVLIKYRLDDPLLRVCVLHLKGCEVPTRPRAPRLFQPGASSVVPVEARGSCVFRLSPSLHPNHHLLSSFLFFSLSKHADEPLSSKLCSFQNVGAPGQALRFWMTARISIIAYLESGLIANFLFTVILIY